MYNDGDLPPGFERNKVEYYGYERRAAETAYNEAYNRGDRRAAEYAQDTLRAIREAENSIGRDFDGDGNEIGRSSVPALNIYRRRY